MAKRDKTITLQIAVGGGDEPIRFQAIGGSYSTRVKAMAAAKRLAGRGADYCGDGLGIRYAGEAGTVYVCE